MLFRSGVCFFLPEIDLPKDVKLRPSLVVLDLRYARWVRRAENLARWVKSTFPSSRAITLYTIGDTDTRSALCQAGFVDIPFDHAAIGTCLHYVDDPGATSSSVDLSLGHTTHFLTRNHIVDEIVAPESLDDLYSANAQLLYEQYREDNPDLNRARWLLAVLSQMPVPLPWYEITVRGMGRSTLKRLIEMLGILSRKEKGSGAIIQTVRMYLQRLYIHLEQHNPRADALRHLVANSASDAESNVLVLLRDRAMAQALDSWLTVEACPGAGWLTKVEIKSYDTYSEIASQQYESVIINGTVPRRYRWVLGGALGRRVTFLGYSYESDLVEQHLKFVYGETGRSANLQMRERSVQMLLGTATTAGAATPCAIAEPPTARLILKRRNTKDKPSSNSRSVRAEGGFTGLSDALKVARNKVDKAAVVARSVEQDTEDEMLANEDIGFGEENSDRVDRASSCFSVRVRSRRYGRGDIWLVEDSLVECVRPSSGEEIWRIPPRSLKIGDVLLRMENSEVRGSLFDQMVHLAEGQPEMDYLASFRKSWREAIQKIISRNRTACGIEYVKVFEALRAAGAPISSEQTVRLWMHDQVIGPEAVGSIEAVGKISGSGALVAQAKRFDAAFRSIRAIHQGIGRSLSSAIRQSFRHLNFGEVKTRVERLNDRLGIPLDELVETVDLAEVLSVGSTTEEKSGQIVNRFYPAEGN